MLGWWWRAKARLRLGHTVEVWYHPDYAPASLSRGNRTGLQLERGELIIDQLAREGLLGRGQVRRSEPVATADLLRVHPAAHLERSARRESLARIFGLAEEEVEVEPLLRAQLLQAGGTLAAAEAVVADGGPEIAFHLGGGFHHAHPEQGGGFCVFNDVAVAVARLRRFDFHAPIAIVDLDFHQGDGNLVAFAEDETVLTYSLHGARWTHSEAKADLQVQLPSGTDDAGYLARLRETLPGVLRRHAPGLVFYIAGNDVLAGDRLGDFRLSQHGVLERDRLVVELARQLGARLVVLLGGGYSAGAWQASANLLRWILTGDRRVRRNVTADIRTHYRRVFTEIDPFDLQRQELDLELSEADLFADLGGQRGPRLVLDYYSRPGIEFALERYGLLDRIRSRGYRALEIEVEPNDPSRQLVRITGQGADSARHLLVELVLRRSQMVLPGRPAPAGPVTLLGIEWLLLQDPTAHFSLARPRLPGQTYPGLGMAREFIELLMRICDRLALDGLLNRPAHYHTAAHVSPGFHFLDPVVEGRVRALRRVLRGVDWAEATNLVEHGQLRLADGTPVLWQPLEHVMAVSDAMHAFFGVSEYRVRAAAEEQRLLEAGLAVVD